MNDTSQRLTAHELLRRRLVGGALLTGFSSGVLAQSSTPFPNRLVKLIVPYAPGGPVDNFARPFAQRLTEVWGQSAIVENKAGASATIGSLHVSRATPDGYTLLVCNASEIVILPVTSTNLPYDPVKDFSPVTQLLSGPMVLVTPAGSPFTSLQDLIAAAKRRPKVLTYGSVGQGSISHVAGELLNSLAGIQLLHIPYKGAGPVITDLLGNHIDVAFVGVSVAANLITTGKLRALGVTTTKRSMLFPEVPALSEQLPGFEVNSWYGIMAPPATPKNIIQKVYESVVTVMKQPDFAEMLRGRGSEIEASTPEQFSANIKADIARFAATIKAAGIKPEPIN